MFSKRNRRKTLKNTLPVSMGSQQVVVVWLFTILITGIGALLLLCLDAVLELDGGVSQRNEPPLDIIPQIGRRRLLTISISVRCSQIDAR